MGERRKRRKMWTIGQEVLPAQGSVPPPRVRSIPPADMNVVFQPIVDLHRQRIYACEMLARCTRVDLKNPAVLFEQAALQSSTGRLGRTIREVGFAQAPKLPLFINLHPHELSERWIVRPDDPMNFFEHGLYLEITESAALDYYDLCRGALKELCARLGARLVVDDFGAAYSNLIRIADLNPAVVKLDRGLVADVDRHVTKRKILKHVVALCHDLGCHVIAEGIETLDELQVVIDSGVRYAQGFLLARPGNPMPELSWPLQRSGQ